MRRLKDIITCPRSHNKLAAEAGLEPQALGVFGAAPCPMESQTHSAGLPTDAVERAWQTRNSSKYLTADSCCFFQTLHSPVDVA